MLLKYYSIRSPEELNKFLQIFIPLVINVANTFSVDLTDKQFQGDHLGLQVLGKEEFDSVDKMLLQYSSLVHDNIIHKRRNRVYQFKNIFVAQGIKIPRIEIFEPKPDADLQKLKPGIEHMAFMTDDYDSLLSRFEEENLPIDKQKVFDDGSKFFKTSLINLVEIEFRNDFLGVSEK